MSTTTSSTVRIPEIDADADVLTAALAYAKAGLFVGPAKRGTKNPGSVLGKQWQTMTSCDPEQIVAWFAGTDHDVFIHCGRSGAVVIDVDYPEHVPPVLAELLELAPYHSTRPETPGRGHYVFTQPPGRNIGNRPGKLGGRWGEIRGHNGVVIVAPSHHKHGGEYRWERTGVAPVLPDAIAELLPDAAASEQAATDEVVAEFIAEHIAATRPGLLHGWRKALLAQFETGSRHQAAVSVMAGALKEARSGYFTAATAMETLRPLFIIAATRPPTGGEKQRTDREAMNEWNGIVAWAVAQANSADLDAVRARTEEKMPTNVTTVTTDELGGTRNEADKPANVHSGQARFAYRFADRYDGRFIHVAGIGWHAWDGTRFVADERGETIRSVLHELRLALAESLGDKELRADVRKCESASGVAGVLSIAAALEQFAATVADLDADPFLLNVANGTLDLRTWELRPHSPSDAITKICRGAYTDDAQSALWETFLARVLPDESVRSYVQRLVGLGLLGAVRENILTIFTGTGANGKSVIDRVIRWALGDYAITAEPDLFMHREGAHPTGELDLRGARWVTVSESDKDRRLAEATMKRLTGGDRIRARRMRQDFVEFDPSHTATLITNHLPKVAGDDPAIWRRIRVVPFDITIPADEQDTELGERLELDADAILSWAIEGWRQYQERGLDEPAGVIAATDQYQADSDAISRFISECCHVSPAVQSVTGQLFERWEKWRITDGAEQMSLKAFGMALTNKGFECPRKSVNGKKWRKGIALAADEDGGDDDE